MSARKPKRPSWSKLYARSVAAYPKSMRRDSARLTWLLRFLNTCGPSDVDIGDGFLFFVETTMKGDHNMGDGWRKGTRRDIDKAMAAERRGK